jgi:hypothetical protein
MPEVQYVNSMEQMPKASQSAWSFYHLLRQPLDEAKRESEETIPSIELKTPEVYSTGSRHQRGERGGHEAPVQVKIGATTADEVVEIETLLLPGTGEPIPANPPQTGSIATCLARMTADLRADGEWVQEKEEGDLAREGSEAENELVVARMEEIQTGINW